MVLWRVSKTDWFKVRIREWRTVVDVRSSMVRIVRI